MPAKFIANGPYKITVNKEEIVIPIPKIPEIKIPIEIIKFLLPLSKK